MVQRGEGSRLESLGEGGLLLHNVVREVDALGKGDERRLANNGLEYRATLRYVQQLVDREARGCRQARERAEERVLVPQNGLDVVGYADVDVRGTALIKQPFGPLALRAVKLPDTIRQGPPICSTTPGSTMCERMNAAPPSTCSDPI